MSEHALFSPSGAHRWMRCAASLNLEQLEPRTSSSYAEEGVAAHHFAAMILEGNDDVHMIGGKHFETGYTFTPSMHEHVMTYVNAVHDYAKGHLLLVEQRVDFSSFIQCPNPKDAFGTADAIVLTSDGTEIQTHDLKFGMGIAVYADNNEQLMLYALGAYNLLKSVEDVNNVETIRLVIHQPRQERLSEWTCTLEELFEFAERAKLAAAATQVDYPEFVPGEKQCEFCKIKGKCRALANHVLRTVGDTFDDLDNPESLLNIDTIIDNGRDSVALMTSEQLGALYFNLDLIHDWIKAIRGRIEGELLAGNEVPGLKLVEGKMGNRQWGNKAEVETLMKTMRIKADEMYDKSLISPTTAEKVLKKTYPRKWSKIEEMIVQKKGQPSVAPESDKRPALIITANGDDFDNIEEVA